MKDVWIKPEKLVDFNLDKHHSKIFEELSLYQQVWDIIKHGISNHLKVIIAAG